MAQMLTAIGTSTGGTQALQHVHTALPQVCPGMVIVQHWHFSSPPHLPNAWMGCVA
jgi:chemotaxis response regulator CheB